MSIIKRKILVVDDSDNNLYLLEEILFEYDYSVITASGGQEAVDKIAANPPDLILLDIMMPEYSGYNVLEFLIEQKIEIPVIVISARTSQEDIDKAMNLGAKYFIRKPVIITNVLEKIEEILDSISN